MPCRNAGPYLMSAVQSVLAQPECLELLLADGGSTDGSLQLLENLACPATSMQPGNGVATASDAKA